MRSLGGAMDPHSTDQLRCATHFDDLREQRAIEVVRRMGDARPRLEQVLDPFAPLGEPVPECVGAHLALDQLLPQHAVGDDAQPLFAHQLGGGQRLGVQVGENGFGNVVEAFFCG